MSEAEKTRPSDQKYTSMKVFSFEGDDSKSSALRVNIPEVADSAYGMYTWPCAPVLAQYVWKHRLKLQGKVVLEIGSGTALAGVVAAKCGAEVILSDSTLFPDCLENCRKSCHANDLKNVKVIPLTWGLVTLALLQLPAVDFILGSDCFYDTKDFEDVLVTVSFLLKRNPDCQFWTTYQKRSAMRSIEFYLKKWGLAAEEVPVTSFFHKDGMQHCDYPGVDSVHMFDITLDQRNSSCGSVT
ncbi:histone-arginine methyltransferase METTL23-like [Littorina saxatilis]|uniref:Methyltransferase-like protein 23 n=1 Tax=Littorina saxatilis TaxID=31220 RepID=A0AAN9GLJ3_9CAEN